jgi:outer membrane protein assembly factor BamB
VTNTWTTVLTEPIEPPLAVDEQRVYVATRDGIVRGLDRASGHVLWEIKGRPGRVGAGPGLLAVKQADGVVWGMDPRTGSARFKVDSGIKGTLAPLVDRDRVIVAGEGIAALRTDDGKPYWSHPGPPSVTAPPVVSGAFVLVGESDGTLRSRDRASGAPFWSHRTGSALLAPPVADERGRLFLGTTDRQVLALSGDDGKKRWRWKVGADVQTVPAVFGRAVLVTTHEAVLYALDRGHGSMLWRAPLPSRPLSGPLLVGSAALVACYEKDLLGFDARSGKRLGALKTSAEIATVPVLLNGKLYVGLRDRSIVAMELGGLGPSPAPSPTRSPAVEPQS